MVTIKLSDDPTAIVAFEGAVVELFQDVTSSRIHVSLLTNMQLKTDKKGRHSLEITTIDDGEADEYEVDANAYPKVALLIAQVEKAKGVFRFD